MTDMYKTRHPLYGLYKGMLGRCDDPNNRYCQRKIKVHDSWRGPNGFWQFVEDVPPRPSRFHTLDRYPNPWGNYEPTNVRWATPVEQSRNKINSYVAKENGVVVDLYKISEDSGLHYNLIQKRWVSGMRGEDLVKPPQRPDKFLYRGKYYNIKQLASICDKSAWLLHDRIRARGMSVEDAVNLPKDPNPRKIFIDYKGRKMTLTDLAKEVGIQESTLRNRYNNGLRDEDLIAPLFDKVVKKVHLYDGKLRSLQELSDICGISVRNLKNRICILGWSVEDSMKIPIHDHKVFEVMRPNKSDFYQSERRKKIADGIVSDSSPIYHLGKLITLLEFIETTKIRPIVVKYRYAIHPDVDYIVNGGRADRRHQLDGEGYTLTELCFISGIKYGTLYKRILCMKMPVKKAIGEG